MDTLIFVSSSQASAHRLIADATADLINGTQGFSAFFAPHVHEATPPTDEIFRALQDCAGMVAFLHGRGTVHDSGEPPFVRSSVWVNQELALIAYRRFDLGYTIPVLAFSEPGTRWEGVLAYTMINPVQLGSRDEVLAAVSHWLRTADFVAAASGGEELFRAKWAGLTAPTKCVVRALLDEGGVEVRDTPLRVTVQNRYIHDKTEASRALLQATTAFETSDLVLVASADPGHRRFTINKRWRGRIVRQLRSEGLL